MCVVYNKEAGQFRFDFLRLILYVVAGDESRADPCVRLALSHRKGSFRPLINSRLYLKRRRVHSP